MINHKTTMQELFLNIWPMMAKLGDARLKNGRSQLDMARNYQTIQFAIQPLEKMRESLNGELAEMKRLVDSGEVEATELAAMEKEANKRFAEALTAEHKVSVWLIPYSDIAEHLSVQQTAGLMFMLEAGGEDDKS